MTEVRKRAARWRSAAMLALLASGPYMAEFSPAAAQPTTGSTEVPAPGSNATEPSSTFKVALVYFNLVSPAMIGFKEYLQSSGLSIRFIDKSLNGDMGRLPQVVAELKEARYDLIFTQNTNLTLGVVGADDAPTTDGLIHDLPVVFTLVADPVGSRIAPPPRTETAPILSHRNVTGTIHVVSREILFNAIRSYMPVKRLAVAYDARSSVGTRGIDDFRVFANTEGVELIPVALPPEGDGPSQERLSAMLEQLARETPDILFIPPITALTPHIAAFTAEAMRLRIPTFCALETYVERGCMAGLIAPLYNIGQLTGYKAEMILRGEAQPSEIAIESLSHYSFVVNVASAHAVGVYPPIRIIRYAQFINVGPPPPHHATPDD